MQLALHLPKQPVFTVLDLQAVHHILSQLVSVLGGKNEPTKLPSSLSLAQCCAMLQLAVLYAVLPPPSNSTFRIP